VCAYLCAYLCTFAYDCVSDSMWFHCVSDVLEIRDRVHVGCVGHNQISHITKNKMSRVTEGVEHLTY